MSWDLLAPLSESFPPAAQRSFQQPPNLHDHLETKQQCLQEYECKVESSYHSGQRELTGWNAMDLHQRGGAVVDDGGEPRDGILEDLVLIWLHQV